MRVRFAPLLIPLTVLGTLGCSSPGGELPPGFEDRQVVIDFADQVVVPTYRLLATRVGALRSAVEALAANPSPDTLSAAQGAWLAARQPWEQSEGFLFGPVDSFGYDPAMDSWPVNRTDLDAVLASGASFTPEYIGNLQETQKGFHTLEYLLFGVDRTRVAADLGARELMYATALAAELTTVATALAARWTDSVEGRPPFRDVLAGAGQPGNTSYPSLTAAAQEILDGMIGICDEVANGKLADPYDAHDAALVESQFAANSLADFQDNLRSVENAYTASVPAAASSGRGLSAHVATLAPELDARVRREIQDAIAAIGAIPPPFRDAIKTPTSYDEIEAAQAAIRRLQRTLERDVQPLVLR
ncbi:MAG: peptidase M75 [Deltaproteobacteria bacterium]|nr:peptidase M75 [Deltaproteobacteria bacterium]